MIRCCIDESDLLVVLWLPLLNSLIRDRARVLTSIGIQAAFIGDGQNDESVTRKKGVEGGLSHVVLGTMDESLIDRYPYLQVQLTGKLQKTLTEFQ